MQKHFITIGIVGVILGVGIGYALAATRDVPDALPQVGMHQMPDGSLMGDSGMSMRDMMADMNRELAGKTGDAFDQAFLAEMIVHHQGAVGMAEAALQNARHEEIKDLARAIIDAQNREITQMQDWQQAWYGR